MASGRIKGLTIEINGDSTKLTKALSQVDKALKTTQTNLKDVDKLLKFDPGNTELLRQKQKLLGDAVSQTKDRLHQLQDAQSQVSKGTAEWDALQREIIETEQNLDKLKGDVISFGSVAGQKIQLVGQKFQEVGGKIQAAGQKMAAVSGAATAALGGIAKLGYDAVKSADDLNTLSKQTGVSTDELQKWSYAADLVDVSTETITSSMKKMKKNLSSNAKAFEELGIKTTDSNGQLRDSTSIFYDTIEALSKIDNETERDIAAMSIFGKSADDLSGIIDDGGEALKQYGKEAEQLGLIISGDTLNKLNETNDTIDKLKAQMAGSFAQAGATIAQTFAPAVEKVAGVVQVFAEKIRNLSPEQAELITKILAVVAAISPVLIIVGKLVSGVGSIISVVGKISGLLGPLVSSVGGLSGVITALTGPIGIIIAAVTALVGAFIYFYNTNEEFRNKVNEILEQVKAYFLQFVEQAKAWFQEFIEFCRPIFEALGQYFMAVGEAIGQLLVVIGGVLSQIGAFISDFVQKHQTEIQAFITKVQTIVSTRIEIIRTIIVTVLNVITSLVKAFTAVLQGDWDAAWQHVKNATTAAKNGVINIIKSMFNMIDSLFNGMVSKFLDWGHDMIDGLVQGIKDKIDVVKEAIGNVAGAIFERLHFSEPDVGPLSNFHTYAPDMMKLFADGIKQNAHLITDAIGSSFDLRPYFTDMSRGINNLNNIGANLANNSANTPVVVQVQLQGDAQRLFHVLSQEAHKDWMVTGQSRLMGY